MLCMGVQLSKSNAEITDGTLPRFCCTQADYSELGTFAEQHYGRINCKNLKTIRI